MKSYKSFVNEAKHVNDNFTDAQIKYAQDVMMKTGLLQNPKLELNMDGRKEFPVLKFDFTAKALKDIKVYDDDNGYSSFTDEDDPKTAKIRNIIKKAGESISKKGKKAKAFLPGFSVGGTPTVSVILLGVDIPMNESVNESDVSVSKASQGVAIDFNGESEMVFDEDEISTLISVLSNFNKTGKVKNTSIQDIDRYDANISKAGNGIAIEYPIPFSEDDETADVILSKGNDVEKFINDLLKIK